MVKASTFIRIPLKRLGVLIGPEGKTKKNIEKKLLVELNIDSETGGITVALAENARDPSCLFVARNTITAIGRGFSPEHAFRLINDEEAILEVIDLRRIFGKSLSDVRRVKGRIIGMNGKTRKTIEELTDTKIAVYGYTVSIIGNFEQTDAAKAAIQMLIRGSPHYIVNRFLQRKRGELKKRMLEIWKNPSKEIMK